MATENPKENGPRQIHFISRIIKRKEGLRDADKILSLAQKDPEYKDFVSKIGGLFKTGASFNPVSEALFQLSGIIGKHFGSVDGKDLGG